MQANATAGVRVAKGEIQVRATAEIMETDRVSPRADSNSDTVYTFTPTLSYLQESSKLNINANLSLPYTRYDSSSELDSNAIRFSLSGNVPYGAGPRLSGNWSVNYFDGVQANYLTNRNTQSETFSASVSSNYQLQNKLSLRSSLGHNERSTSNVGLNINPFANENTTTYWSAGVHAREILGRVGVYVDYRLQKRETNFGAINGGVDDIDDGINFGITGQILPERLFPKLEADLSFGFTSSEANDSFSSIQVSKQQRLTLNGSLVYPANPKTDVALTYNRDLMVTDDDRTVEQGNLNLSIQYKPAQKLSFSGSVGLQSNDYIYDIGGRNDDAIIFNLTTHYAIRTNWTANISYNYRNSESDFAISDYNSSQLSISSTVSY